MSDQNKNVQTALMEFKFQDVSHEQLAKFTGFSDKELDMLKIFWGPCFNKSWIYLPREMIEEWFCKDDKSTSAIKNFYNRVLFKMYEENYDHKELDASDLLIKEYNSHWSKMTNRKNQKILYGNRAKYYAVTGECFKMICMERNKGIRKYYIKVEELCILMKDYIQGLQAHNIKLQQQLFDKQIETQKQLLIESKEQIEEKEREHIKQLEEEKKKNMVLTNFVENAKAKVKNQIFYIVTTDQYTAQNRYKFGGVDRRSSLKSNLNNYNRGECEGNKHYYVYIKECYNYKAIEQLLKSAIPVFFKDNKSVKNEMVHCHYDIFKEVVDTAIDNTDGFIDHVNGLIKRMIQLTIYETPVHPKPIDISKRAVLTITENGEEKTTVFNWDTMTDEEVYQGIKICLRLYAKEELKQEWIYDSDKDNKELQVIWKDFKQYLINQFNIPKYGFKAMSWRKKIEPLDNNAKRLNVTWVRRKGRLVSE